MNYTLFFLALTVLISCKNSSKQTIQESSEITEKEAVKDTLVLPVENPSAANSQLPRLFSDGNALYFSWVTRKDSTDQLYYSVFNQNAWQPTHLVAQGNDWFTNWADFPAIAANDEAILTNHLQKSADGTYTYDVMLNMIHKNLPSPSTKGTKQTKHFIKENFILHNDGTQSEHGFVSMLPYQNNSFFITWLDGRNTTGGSHDNHDTHHGGGAMTLRAAVIPATGEIAQRTELDNRVCDCCQTSAAMTSNGPVVAYRDRSEDEIRDISIVRNVNRKWLGPQSIGEDNWKIAGCPVNGPSIDAIGDDLAIAWFTAASGEGDVKVIFSEDAGKTFTRAYRIDAGSATGRVDIVMLDNKEAAVLWMQPLGEEEVIYLMKIGYHGYTGKPIVISQTTADRASGFPQLERLGNTLYVAWTEVEENSLHINMASVLVSAL